MSEQDPRLATERAITENGPMVTGPASRRMEQVFAGEQRVGMLESQKWAIRLGLSLVIIGGSASGMYYFYTKGLEDGVRLEPPLMVAEEAPIKVRPAEPGGKQVPHQDKLVYEQLSGDGVETTEPPVVSEPAEGALPRPQVSTDDLPRVLEPEVSPTPENTIFAEPALPQADSTAEGVPSAQTAAPSAAELGTPGPVVAADPGVDAPGAAADGPQPLFAGAADSQAPQQNQPVQPPAVANTAPQSAASQGAAPKTSVKPAASSPASGPFYAQLGSFRENADATKEGKRLQGAYPDVLGGLKLRIHDVDLGDKGVYHRILMGGFAEKSAARAVCQALAVKKIESCLVNRID